MIITVETFQSYIKIIQQCCTCMYIHVNPTSMYNVHVLQPYMKLEKFWCQKCNVHVHVNLHDCTIAHLCTMQVYIGDKVVLTPVSTGQPLHVSDLSLPDHPDCREVNADPAG